MRNQDGETVCSGQRAGGVGGESGPCYGIFRT